MEQLSSLVSSRGLLRSCDSHNRAPRSSSSEIDLDIARDHRAGGTIYVCTDALRGFAEQVLPSIADPFVLVTGDSDTRVDDRLLSDDMVGEILRSGKLVRWFAQNLSAKDPNLEHLPIGLDYHTMRERPGLWGLSETSAIAQEHLLIDIVSRSRDFSQRFFSAYCNWHFQIDRGDRREALEKIDRGVCFFEPRPVPRAASWERQAECMFVVSPEGEGMDCHRTWEALALGCVPIVKTNALSPLFESLPVMVVRDWGDVTRSHLLDFASSLQRRIFDFSSLFLASWNRRIRGASSGGGLSMTLAEFRSFLTKRTA